MVDIEHLLGGMTPEETADLALYALSVLDTETAIETVVAFAEENESLGIKDELQSRLAYDEDD